MDIVEFLSVVKYVKEDWKTKEVFNTFGEVFEGELFVVFDDKQMFEIGDDECRVYGIDEFDNKDVRLLLAEAYKIANNKKTLDSHTMSEIVEKTMTDPIRVNHCYNFIVKSNEEIVYGNHKEELRLFKIKDTFSF